MPQSQQQGLCAAVAALLLVSPAVASGHVDEDRSLALANGVDEQVEVNLAGSVPPPADQQLVGSPLDWSTTIEITVKTRRTTEGSAAVRADAIWTEIYARVMADPSLSGRAQMCTPGEMQADPDEGDTDVCRLIWRVTYEHRTTHNSIQ